MNIDEIIRDAILKRLGEKYEYIKTLRGGNFSHVYLLKHLVFYENHVLKVVNSKFILEQLMQEDKQKSKEKYKKIKERFLNEARLLSRINHPNIVRVHDVDIFSDRQTKIDIPFFTMDCVIGKDLAVTLKEKSPMDFKRVLELSMDILGALRVLHQNGIVHRDLKPANIMVDQKGKGILIDFGLAKDLLSNTNLTSTGSKLGTPSYMSPEQLIDSSKVGPLSDIYSFGAILFELLTGEPPFKRDTIIEVLEAHLKDPVPDVREKRPDAPVGIGKVIQKAMEKDENSRFMGAEAMMNELKKFE